MHKASRSAIDVNLLLRWLGAMSVLALLALAVVPLETLEQYPAFCPFKRFLGIECYGCGMTRALCALLHGHAGLALQYNRGVLIAFPILVLCGACISLPELKKALTLSWVIASVITLCLALTPWVVSAAQIARMTPRCERKAATGDPCFFCGMTTGFIEIAHGRLRQAARANRGSVPLYAGFAGNGVCLCLFLARKAGRRT